jgi:hypothetical protein
MSLSSFGKKVRSKLGNRLSYFRFGKKIQPKHPERYCFTCSHCRVTAYCTIESKAEVREAKRRHEESCPGRIKVQNLGAQMSLNIDYLTGNIIDRDDEPRVYKMVDGVPTVVEPSGGGPTVYKLVDGVPTVVEPRGGEPKVVNSRDGKVVDRSDRGPKEVQFKDGGPSVIHLSEGESKVARLSAGESGRGVETLVGSTKGVEQSGKNTSLL